jgi:hypothetical protein
MFIPHRHLCHSYIYSLFLILVLRIIQIYINENIPIQGESNNHVGNKRYRKVVDERKAEYRKINSKQRKLKTVFVRDIVSYINKCGGRFIDVDSKGKYYVVTMEKARKKT